MDVKARVSSGDELLNEKFTIPSIITTPNPIDFNTFTTSGIYYVGAHSTVGGLDTNFINNGPINNWGTLIVSGRIGTLFQLFFTDNDAGIYHRSVNNKTSTKTNIVWNDWIKLVDKNTTLDKAFPVGFSYLTADNDKSHVPSFGAWSIDTYVAVNDKGSPFSVGIPIFRMTRIA